MVDPVLLMHRKIILRYFAQYPSIITLAAEHYSQSFKGMPSLLSRVDTPNAGPTVLSLVTIRNKNGLIISR
jgi:hypothetical protein